MGGGIGRAQSGFWESGGVLGALGGLRECLGGDFGGAQGAWGGLGERLVLESGGLRDVRACFKRGWEGSRDVRASLGGSGGLEGLREFWGL